MTYELQNLKAELSAAVANRQHAIDDYERTGSHISQTFALIWKYVAKDFERQIHELEGRKNYE